MRSRILARVLVGALLVSILACSSQPPPPKVVPIDGRTPPPAKK